ncbi:hypothetical protein FZC66_06340 [Priestia megaterium]|nr:hypothetical protein FZC66_06340 [Priestia megaterium]
MENQAKEIIGAWIAAIGTISSAIGSTSFRFIKSEVREDLNLWGNVLQGTGNALVADGQEGISLEKIGNEIQSVGNITVIAGLVIDFEDETQQKLIIAGNLIQALGGAAALGDEFQDVSTAGDLYNIYGNLLQAIGNSLQAIGGAYELRSSINEQCEARNDQSDGQNDEDEYGQSLDVVGSWIQAIGSVLSVIGQIREETAE